MHHNKLFYTIFLSCFLIIFLFTESKGQGSGTIIISNETVPASSGVNFSFELNYEEPIDLEILSPITIAGHYTAASSSFGPLVKNTSYNGDIQLADPLLGWPAPLADLSGKIALIERDNIRFATKVKFAQDAGAIAVIVYNNQPGAAILHMGGQDPSITIPSCFISNDDGLIIKAALSSSTNATIKTGLKERFTLQHGEFKNLVDVPAGNHTIDMYATYAFSPYHWVTAINIADPSGGSSADLENINANIGLATDETVNVTYINNLPVYANSRTFLEGPYNTTNGNMNNNLNYYGGGNPEWIPEVSPYLADPQPQFSYPVNWVDWILVELKDKDNPSTLIASRSAYILSNGDIVDLDGTSPVGFKVVEGDYYIAVTHRNHLSVMSKNPVHLSNPSVISD